MSKETREMVDNILKSLDVKYRSGEWYRVDDVRKLLHKLVGGYNKQIEWLEMSDSEKMFASLKQQVGEEE